MNDKTGPYHVIDFPTDRRVMAGILDHTSGMHLIYALLEVDVTVAKQFIEEYKAQTGELLLTPDAYIAIGIAFALLLLAALSTTVK